ncbi:Gtr1/RagA G protein conserved region-domain-containing protein [Crepidotus variabilis]|uniref:Gtr1/RagA G protein conserved region-domain-containing protein n=1 Tax=Crepidotus variabilis TaxID=179855 RepID=A0A9P6EP12_9AGAR|nr:Gtr1/RagA G protein conserved region-domain-containing protein [Crepidotus variabilis]
MATQNYAATSTTTPLAQRPRLNVHRSNSDPVARTKILLLGMRRAGKTSIQQVLFKNLPPKETFYLETTMRIVKHRIDTVIPLELWDCPANTTVASLGVPLSQFAAIIFVIDIRDLYNQPISKLVDFIQASYTENPEISIEVFVHKAEKLQEDDKIENFRQIHDRVNDRLSDLSPDYEQMHINFHLTSVYDHSLHEAFSKVLHRLIESLPYLEELLNVFCANSQSPKAFLFDIRSRLYIATDASPVDSATHNLCCDYLLMLNSFGPLYRSIIASPDRQKQLTGASQPNTFPSVTNGFSPRSHSATSSANHSPAPLRLREVNGTNGHGPGHSSQNGVTSPTSPTSPRAPTPVSPATPRPNHVNGHLNGAASRVTSGGRRTPIQSQPPPTPPATSRPASIRPSGSSSVNLVRNASSSNLRSHSQSNLAAAPSYPKERDKKELFYPSASTNLSAAASPQGGGSTALTYHLITKNLALLALIPSAVFEERRGLVEYNVVFFREGVQEICDVEEEVRVIG